MTLATKEFNGQEFHSFCQQEYDAARRYLKSCGKPTDDVDRFLIQKYRDDASVFGGMLDSTDALRRISTINAAKKEQERLRNQLHLLDTLLGCPPL